MDILLQVFASTPENKAAGDVLLPALLERAEPLDPENTGGAMLLGLKGVCIISHGSSTSRAIVNASPGRSRSRRRRPLRKAGRRRRRGRLIQARRWREPMVRPVDAHRRRTPGGSIRELDPNKEEPPWPTQPAAP